MSKPIWILPAVIIIAAGYYLLSPLWRVIEVDEDLIFTEMTQEGAAVDQADDADDILPPIEANEEMPEELVGEEHSEPAIIFSGSLIPDAHDVEGTVTVYQSGEQRILRFEDLNTVNGPGLHIYLATDTKATDYIDLGDIRATKGNVNYELDPSIDLSTYSYVLIWCEPFGVNFSYAVLK